MSHYMLIRYIFLLSILIQEPEFAKSFFVELIGAQPGASLDPNRKFADITMADSDYPYGLMRFTTDTRYEGIHYYYEKCSFQMN